MKVILINGPMGVGKTAAGRYIAGQNPGTAFIDGDWCMDIHPFVGNRETKAMAVDNILHMISNYGRCSACKMTVLAWLMDDSWVLQRLMKGLADLHSEIQNVTLVCSRESLISRWRSDHSCEWRTDRWLRISLASLPRFAAMDHTIDTSGLTVEQTAAVILSGHGSEKDTGRGTEKSLLRNEPADALKYRDVPLCPVQKTQGSMFVKRQDLRLEEVSLTEKNLSELISLSTDWEAENSCYGYRANQKEDIEGNRIFLAREQGRTVGYLFGHVFPSENMRAIMPEGASCFEVEEIYVIPSARSSGIGRALFEFAAGRVQDDADYITLSTATKDWKAILHFYLDELDMSFWSARLFKRIIKEKDGAGNGDGSC